MTVPRKTGRGQWVCCFSPLMQCSLSLHKDWSGLPSIKCKSAVPSRPYPSQHGLCGLSVVVVPVYPEGSTFIFTALL